MPGASDSRLLDAQVAIELDAAVPAAVRVFAARLAARIGPPAVAVLYYGSTLREGTHDGLLDFYVLTDAPGDGPGSRWARWANRWLPPQVGWIDDVVDGRTLRAKYALLSSRQFASAMRVACLDTTIWARFSQPCACVWLRDGAAGSEAPAARALRAAVVDAIVTAARWAAWLGPERAPPLDYWRALYAHTYAAELRVERSSRGADLVAAAANRYAALLVACWRYVGIDFETFADGSVAPRLGAAERRAARRRWRRRQRLGRPLNLLRLAKATLTFDRAIDYVAWKVERHSGVHIEPTAFQRRHPLLAAPFVYWRLRRERVLR